MTIFIISIILLVISIAATVEKLRLKKEEEAKRNNLSKQDQAIRTPINHQNNYEAKPNYKKSSTVRSQTAEYMKYTRARKLTENYVVFDFETTGFDVFESQIIQIAAVQYENHKKIDEYVTFVNPRFSIPEKITQITGISDNDVRDAPVLQNVLPDLISFIQGYDLVAHNASFDMKFLLYSMNKFNIPYQRFRVLDTLSLARKYINTENHKLVTLKKHFKLDEYVSHNALDDCFVTGEVYKYCYEQSMQSIPS